MNWIRNISVRRKMIFLTASITILMLVVAGISFYYLQSSNNKTTEMYRDKLQAIVFLEESKTLNMTLNADLFELMTTTDMNRNSELEHSIVVDKDSILKYLKQYEATKLEPFEITVYSDLKNNIASADESRREILALALANKNAEAYAAYNNTLKAQSEKIAKDLSDLTVYNNNSAKQLNKKNGSDFTKSRIIILSIILFSLVFSILLANFIINLIARPIKVFSSYIEKVAAGELDEATLQNETKHVKVYKDEIGKLGKAILEMRKQLNDLLRKVSDATEQVAAMSEELTANAEQSSSGVTEIASAVTVIAEGASNQLNTVTQTSNNIHQMSERMLETASNTNETANASTKAYKATKEGENAINNTIEQMNNIERTVVHVDQVVRKLGDRSKEISQIIDAISAIAQQTNLLALNAAIEAARAGEQGKGFSVVADEVRKLAEASGESTKKISALIEEIQQDTSNAVSAMSEGTDQVKIGKAVVDKAGQAFVNISELVQQITNQIQEVSNTSQKIAASGQESELSMKEVTMISKGVSEQSQTISASVEEQSAAMQEIAASSESLAKIAQELQTEVSKFKL